MKTLYWISIIFLVFIHFQCLPQQPESPFDQDIRKFKDSDQINPPPADAILFVGSSSFRIWMDVQEDFPGYSSPSRWHLRERFMEGNKLIREFLENQENTGFVNVWDNMQDREGKPEASLFLDDELHMNENGYSIWKTAILPKLIKE